MKKSEKVVLDREKLFCAIKKNGMTKTEVARKCGHSDSWIHYVAKNPTTLAKAELIAERLGVDVADIVKADEPDEVETVRAEGESCSEVVQDERNNVDLNILLVNILVLLKDIAKEIDCVNLTMAAHGNRIAEPLDRLAKAINVAWGVED